MLANIQVCRNLWIESRIDYPQFLSIALTMLVVLLSCMFLLTIGFRKGTKWRLEKCGLPTVIWTPKFIRYRAFEDERKLSSSSITRILPRMERLAGPYGMYGTVYGLNTAVVHVAHPVPARVIFGSTSSTVSTAAVNHIQQKRLSSIAESTGACKAPAYDHFKNFCGEGVFTADGDDWKAKRTAVMHCLIKGTNSSTSDIAQRLENEANRAADVFTELVQNMQNMSCDENAIVCTNVVPLLQRSTVELIYRYITHHEPIWGMRSVGIGKGDHRRDDDSATTETGSVSSTDSSVASQDNSKGDSETANELLTTYLSSIIRIRMIILAQSRSIWFLLPRWCYRTFSSLYRDEEDTVLPIRNFAREACEFALPGSPLAQLKAMETYSKQTMIDGVSKNLLDEAITLLFAGQDTSAATLSWTLHLLSLYPNVQERLAKEIQTVTSEANSTSENSIITRKMISKLPFLDAVIKESMRLYPVAPFVVRRLAGELSIPKEDERERPLVLPAGSVACVWIYSLHRNPKFWNRPNEFLPDRWLDPTMKDIGQTNGAYMPFAIGARNCIGQPIAQVVLRTLLARLLLKFEFRDDRLLGAKSAESLHKDLQAGFTVLPNGGVTLSIQTRKTSTM